MTDAKRVLLEKIAKILSIWVLIIAGLVVCLEIFFFHYFSYIFSLASYNKVGLAGALLTQYSKRSVYPKDYIAIFGDSYAYGQGDWSIDGMYQTRPDHHAAHILQKQQNRDVITFGYPASGSIKAYLILPELLLSVTKKIRLKTVDKPKDIILYFYEGNDINDNVEMAKTLIYPKYELNEASENSIYDEDYFQQVILPDVIEHHPITQTASNLSFFDYFVFLRFSWNMLEEAIDLKKRGAFRKQWQEAKRGETTKIEINGTEAYLPNKIQSPVLSLNQDDINLGLYIFEQSLVALKQRFPESAIGLAYIPAVITPYEVISDSVHGYYSKSDSSLAHMYIAEEVAERSNQLERAVQDIAQRQGLAYVDTRQQLKNVARLDYIHGPRDWHHFNRLGYETLTKELQKLLEQMQ